MTGHRFLAEVDRIAAGIQEAIDHIAAAFPGEPLTVISALAEGADRLVTQEVLRREDSRLVAVLPLPSEEYAKDFASPASKAAFLALLGRAAEVIELPAQPTRERAYEAAGEYVVDHCDVLVAVWDGQGAQGTGGTGEIVVRARRRGLPVAWVHAGNRRPGTSEPTSLGQAQGEVTCEGF